MLTKDKEEVSYGITGAKSFYLLKLKLGLTPYC